MRYIAFSIDQIGEIKPPGDVKIFQLNNILQAFASLFVLGAIFISLVFIIWGALDYILAEGDKQRVQQARQKFIFAIIGLGIVLLSFFVVSLFGGIFGINFFNSHWGNIENPCLNVLPGHPC